MYRSKWAVAIVATAVMLLSACQSTTKQASSGFLQNYQGFADSSEYDNTKVFKAKGFSADSLKAVNSFKIEPFEIWLTGEKVAQFNPSQLRALSSYFHKKLETTFLNNGLKVVQQAQDDSIIIRGAFTNVKLNDPELSATDFIPFRIVLNAGNAAYLEMTDKKDVVTEVSVEMEMVDGKNQQRLFAMMATKYLDDTVANSGEENIRAVKQVLDQWVENFASKLAALRNNKVNQ